MKPFERLKAWRASHTLFLSVYEATRTWPAQERYVLTNQVRRSALSVSSNLAEGIVRRGAADFARFIEIALGSLSELSYQLIAARDLGILDQAEFIRLDGLREAASKLTWSLYRGVRRRGKDRRADERTDEQTDRLRDRRSDGLTD